MKMTKSEDQMLDDLFALGRGTAPVPSDDLIARILHDATMARAVEPAPKFSFWAGFRDMVGGWPAVGGLAMAGVTGVWFGIAPPTSVASFASDLIGTSVTVDLFDDTSSFFAEASIDG